jgi:hypothetical protein
MFFQLTGGGFIPDGLVEVAALGEALGSLWQWIRGPAIAGGTDAFGVFRYFWAGGGRASFMLRGSRVIVDEIYRGTAARAGTAGAMLAKAVQQAGITKPTELFIPNVLQKTGQSTAVLTNVLRDAASEFGGTVKAVSQGVDAGKTWVLVTIGY